MFEVILGYFSNISNVISSFTGFVSNLLNIFGNKEEPAAEPDVEEYLQNDTLFRD
ncbi:MAG: hypothetical protein IJO14_05885 [Clostridia bacterium]|nr:hypothetical protein [Clostridia bacterium]